MKLLYNQLRQVHLKRMTEEIGNYRRNTLITVPEQESPEFLKRFCLLNLVLAEQRDEEEGPSPQFMMPLFALHNCAFTFANAPFISHKRNY